MEPRTDYYKALVIGTSDGIGLALSRRLVARGWGVTGLSRSPGQIDHGGYEHVVVDVTADDYPERLSAICDRIGPVDLCVYCAGIGEEFDADDLKQQGKVFAVNLGGALVTIEIVVARMIASGRGHFIGLSSIADRLVAPQSPSCSASKAALSSYLCALAIALRPRGVHITNVRFGFVDTKMAKGTVRPMMMPVNKAVDVLMLAVRKRPIQLSRPRTVAAMVNVLAKVSLPRTWR